MKRVPQGSPGRGETSPVAFEAIGARIQETLRRLRGMGKLSEHDVKTSLREVRLALLEADVNYRVVKDFIARVSERAVGREVMKSLSPGQQVVKIVHDELARLMGGENSRLAISSRPPTVIMLVGLQGSGKTTTCAKLGALLKRSGRNPLLVAADLGRPAAREQLLQLGAQAGIPVSAPEAASAGEAAALGLTEGERQGRDTILVDTAGRLHIDADLMDELSRLQDSLQPEETLLVVDAMTGQDAVNVAQEFSSRLDLTGAILTKLEGDARGGAALSLRAVTGCPIKFAGTGEKMEDLEPFHPDRMASRILGMGDVLTLIEKAQASLDEEKARALEAKLRRQEFTLEDFLDQLDQVRQMGPMDQLLGMIPGLGGKKGAALQVDEKQLGRVKAIINSMTPEERRRPEIIDGGRRRRIAAGSGTRVQDVNRLLNQFRQMRKLVRQLTEMERGGKSRLLGGRLPF